MAVNVISFLDCLRFTGPTCQLSANKIQSCVTYNLTAQDFSTNRDVYTLSSVLEDSSSFSRSMSVPMLYYIYIYMLYRTSICVL